MQQDREESPESLKPTSVFTCLYIQLHSRYVNKARKSKENLFIHCLLFFPPFNPHQTGRTTELTPSRWNCIFHKTTSGAKWKYFKWHFHPRTLLNLHKNHFQQHNHSASTFQGFNTCFLLFVSLPSQSNLEGVATTTRRSLTVYAKPKFVTVMPLFILSTACFSAPNHSKAIYSHLHTSLLSLVGWPLPTTQSQLPNAA